MPTGNSISATPKGRLVGRAPTGRATFSAILTPAQMVTINAGQPIGLLMALTYANTFTYCCTPAVFKGVVPKGHIKTTD